MHGLFGEEGKWEELEGGLGKKEGRVVSPHSTFQSPRLWYQTSVATYTFLPPKDFAQGRIQGAMPPPLVVSVWNNFLRVGMLQMFKRSTCVNKMIIGLQMMTISIWYLGST